MIGNVQSNSFRGSRADVGLLECGDVRHGGGGVGMTSQQGGKIHSNNEMV